MHEMFIKEMFTNENHLISGACMEAQVHQNIHDMLITLLHENLKAHVFKIIH